MSDRPTQGIGSWAIRRRFMFTVSVFCAGVIVYVLYQRLDSRVAETAVEMSFVTLIGIVSSYVFGAAWQDISFINKTQSRRATDATVKKEGE